ncbi:hypothetical protein M407DRAFT_31195 [Tulasnella calospora MUT 4182]|uniref:Uncharacterized protein n=1 Tax=Tulasnella calospora MUT 4182 TaxID=1051891 RepID=A0A0C3KCJ1_9AGAM|nr:hypothetical protein M407DRAFT_31195 [Tulasnella calospora MUT 4182]
MSPAVTETPSLAVWDLLLLFRVHALWGGHRSIVIGTYSLYLLAYCCHTVLGLISAAQIIPHIYYDPLVRACVVNHQPPMLSAIWAFTLTSETVVFVLTLIKVIEHRASNQINNPLMDSLHYGQIIYNVVIIGAIALFDLLSSAPSLQLQLSSKHVLHVGDDNRAGDANDAASAKSCLFQPTAKRNVVLCRDGCEYADSLGTTKTAMEQIADGVLG